MQTQALQRSHYDVIVVGARCAGAATAMLLARAGANVLVVERDTRGSDTLSTHALMRTGVALLHRWGVLPAVVAAGTPAVRRATFVYGDETLAVAVKPDRDVDALFAPRRMLVDRLLADAATTAGAEFLYGASVDGLSRDAGGRVIGAQLQCFDGTRLAVPAGIVVGADGRQSTVARVVGAAELRRSEHLSAALYAYVPEVASPGYRWAYRPGASAGAIVTNGDVHCVFALLPRPQLRELLRSDPRTALVEGVALADPELADQICNAEATRQPRRFLGAPGHLRQAHGPGWALVGDAGYFKDPITAHGITDALRDASLLATALNEDGPDALAEYQRQRDALSVDLFEATDAVASFAWNLDDLKAHHARIADAMAREQTHMFPDPPPSRRAA
ncbi:MAG: NAD(P)/FAD-dependent oxidoreductase [Pseudomonadota bacterium]